MLREARPAGLLAVARVLPFGVDGLLLRLETVDEVERELMCARGHLLAEERPLEQRLGNLLARPWHGDADTERALDALVLADQDVEDDAVHRIVAPVVGDDAHLRRLLAEAIHPALALLVARRVPSQVVVKDGVEMLLEVDPLGQAVGADEDEVALLRHQRRDAPFALNGRQQAGHRFDAHLLDFAGGALELLVGLGR